MVELGSMIQNPISPISSFITESEFLMEQWSRNSELQKELQIHDESDLGIGLIKNGEALKRVKTHILL